MLAVAVANGSNLTKIDAAVKTGRLGQGMGHRRKPVAGQSNRPKASRGDVSASQIAVFTGTFDPVTLGHIDVITRVSRIFRSVIVGVGSNPDKRSLFTLDERVELVRSCVRELDGVRVESFYGLAVHFVRASGAGVIVRGVRSMADMDYEFTMARTNRSLDPAVETLFLAAHEEFSHVSSTLIRQIAREAGRADLAKFVPAPVVEPLLEKFRKQT
jgi:pantetheine-phosphate adenylyltransferase